MIYTCSYSNFNSELYKGVSISGDKGKEANFKGNHYLTLAPQKKFWKIWKNNIDKIDNQINNEYYIKEYYNHVLSKLDPNKVYNDLYNTFLLCYEDSNKFCHRHIVTAWLELFLDIKTKEVKVENLNITELEKPTWIKQSLEKIIKENTNMKDFNSLRALYLFNLSEELENDANTKEKIYNKPYNHLRQAVTYLRKEAEIAENEYSNNKVKKLIK